MATTKVFMGLPGVYASAGDHIAHIFDGAEQRFEILVPYLKAGLDHGDQCVLVTERDAVPEIEARLTDSGVDVARARESGQLYSFDGAPDAERMRSTFQRMRSVADEAGRELVRVAGDMTWALSRMDSSQALLEWEAVYDKTFPKQSFVALCQYDHTRFNGSTVKHALDTHALAVIGNMVLENPFHRDIDEVLGELRGS